MSFNRIVIFGVRTFFFTQMLSFSVGFPTNWHYFWASIRHKEDVYKEKTMSKSKKNPQPVAPKPIVEAVVAAQSKVEKSIEQPFDDGLYRKIFWSIVLTLLVAMPLLSLQYGITADEWVHKKYGELCLDFFKTLGQNKEAVGYAPKNGEVMYCYGPTLDVFAAIFYQTFHLPPYTIRHIFFALSGVLLITVCGLLGRLLGGNWRAGLISLVFITLSPRIFGDSMNNPKDVSFAAGYLLTIYYLIKFIKELPCPSWRSVIFMILGIGLALGGRVPGLILVAYIPMFVGVEILFRKGLRQTVFGNRKIGKDILVKTATAGVGGYVLGIAFWPFALTNPLTNTLTALKTLTNFPISIKTIFAGSKIYSTALPWYYVPKLMAISTPLFFLVGLLIFAIIFLFSKQIFNKRYLLLLFFVAVFPLVYGVYKHSAFYNGWRHTTFIYPPLLVLSALGFEYLFQKFSDIGKKALTLVLAGLCALPLWSMVKNHPYQYAYYNETIGGMKGAFGNYETDYFGASTRQMADWMKANLDLKSRPIIIATDFLNPMDQYFTEYPNVKVQYHRYYQRAEKDWDYGVFLTTRMMPSHFKNTQFFPPSGTIYKATIDGMPLGVVIKRPSKDDTKGIILLREGKVVESVPVLEQALKADPNNEVILLYLANAYNNVSQYDKALATSQAALAIFPEYGGAMTTMAVSYINLAQYDNAIFMLNEVLNEDPSNKDALNYLSICYDRKGDKKMADFYRQAMTQR